MAREGGAVTGVMSCVVNGIDMGETGEVDEERAQYGSADSSDDALALGGAGSGGMNTAGADGHGACLGSDDGQQSARKPRERSSQGLTAPAHRGFVFEMTRPVSGLARGSRAVGLQTSPSHADAQWL